MNNVCLNHDTSALIEEVLERLEPRLRHLARRQIAKAPEIVELSADDLYQQMCMKIVEKACIDYSFLQQKDAYIIQYGLWSAMSHIKRIRYKYSDWHVVVETEIDELFYCNGRAGPDPSQAVEAREVYDLVSKCPIEYQTVWALLSKGYTYTEAGKLSGLSSYTIGARKKKLVHVVREAYNAPLSHKSAVLEKLRCM
jgi:DNA-directed RNA polymerase specialized sigma24 family protein